MMTNSRELAAVVPDWRVPSRVRAFVTGRAGGVSTGAWGLDGDLPGGLNLGARCGDDPASVAANRARLSAALPSPPRWLRQVHGAAVHVAVSDSRDDDEPVADAAITDRPGVVVAVLTADCLPVFLTSRRGQIVGVAHAGWRGLAAGVLERTVEAMRRRLTGDDSLQAWMGPAIGQAAFEVGDDVFEAFCRDDDESRESFLPGARQGKWFADLYLLARIRLGRAGVHEVGGGGLCTWSDPARFWSYRRRAEGGRMASVIWIDT